MILKSIKELASKLLYGSNEHVNLGKTLKWHRKKGCWRNLCWKLEICQVVPLATREMPVSSGTTPTCRRDGAPLAQQRDAKAFDILCFERLQACFIHKMCVVRVKSVPCEC
ncbi:hypothetical protein AAFF_G00083470 [Aldrovandia affinis]|uniref:Uncharacterized protein n=1 Tax=Aldrovandia affinis TaxID=143900 RepID=A0AAD7WCI1_9TELE|nr:hypothetical protein AAFF_G00083470 [Aldrovandia affinis]